MADQPSAAAEILQYERDVNVALRRLARRTRYEPASNETPLSRLLETEDGALDEWGIRNETIRTFFDYILADGPHPAQILRRLYAVGSHMMIRPFCEMTLREKAMMLGDSHGAQHWRMKRICIDPLLRNGAKSVKAPGQKGLHAQAAAAAAQKGNHNRAGNGKGKAKPQKHQKPKPNDR